MIMIMMMILEGHIVSRLNEASATHFENLFVLSSVRWPRRRSILLVQQLVRGSGSQKPSELLCHFHRTLENYAARLVQTTAVAWQPQVRTCFEDFTFCLYQGSLVLCMAKTSGFPVNSRVVSSCSATQLFLLESGWGKLA